MSEWGNPASRHGLLPPVECIGWLEGTRGSETSQYPQEEKITNDSVSSGERKRKRLNLWCVIPVEGCIMGVVGVSVTGSIACRSDVQACR